MSATTQELVAGSLIRRIRHDSGLKQIELARMCGIKNSVLSAYEHGRRQPGVDSLARIADAVGMELRIVPSGEEMEQVRAGQLLEQVLDLAEQMPYRPRPELNYPPLVRRAA